MKKLTFVEKNDALIRLINKEHFDKDCELLRKLNPTSKLHNEIAKSNEFSISSLCGRILLELLDLTSIEDIEANRKPVKESAEQPYEVDSSSKEEKSKVKGPAPKAATTPDKKKAIKSKTTTRA